MPTVAIFEVSNLKRSLAVATLLLSACSNDEVPADDRGTSSETGGTEGSSGTDETGETGETGACPPGTLDCPCDVDSLCDADLICVGGNCQAGSCGDGVVASDEECDDANDSNTDACLNDCTLANCGDGFVGPGEGCDDGNNDNADACLNTCVDASCGDGVVQAGVEECDDANADNDDTCVSGCKNATCGDGYLGPGEGCDDGNQIDDDACTNGCKSPNCGDAVVDPDEACDDGNDVETDDCLSTCAAASCGDGYVWAGNEECDDGNAFETDTCLSACVAASCGDGYVWQGSEQCDDGNDINDDECTNDCGLPSCGNGSLEFGEECDDGNTNNDDGCNTNCTITGCGDGFTQPGEQCDDGNVLSNDGCSATCTIQKVLHVSAGDDHTCVLTDTATVRCWGYGGHGRLGYGSHNSISDDELPSAAGDVDVGAPVVQISAGGLHTCALLVGGAVRCWGNNDFGQLGHGNTLDVGDNETPGSVATVPIGGSVVDISAGWQHTCAVLDTGAVRCWGRGHYGVLGYGNLNNIGDDETPAVTGDVDVGGPVAKISAGRRHTCALMVSGAVRCWGRNDLSEQLGYPMAGYIGDDETPASVGDVNIGGIAVDVRAGGAHTCVLFDDGEVGCFGVGAGGGLGYGNAETIGDDEYPAEAGFISVGGSTSHITTGSGHTCAVLVGGDVRCWGNYAKLGYPNSTNDIGDDELPSDAGPVSLGGPAVQVDADNDHTCAVLASGAVLCWGENWMANGYGFGTVGDDEHPSDMGPVQVF